MAKKKKVLTAAAAVVTAAAIMLGGTFAWQSISQTALNEASDVINPGGRLHDDFNGENKDVYVENFAEEDIYARIRLSEYFEIVTNYGKEDLENREVLLGGEDDAGERTYSLFTGYDSLDENGVVAGAAKDADGNAYWNWTTGGSTVYMPTFNMNKDSLAADINGIYEDGNVGTISDRILDLDAEDAQYSQYNEYEEGDTLTGDEIYDADANDVEDDGITTVADVEHTAKATGNATLMSMQEWIDAGSQPGEYWVYDTDGWVYWAQAIEPHTATGLLLDGIELNQVMDDTWYYAINVEAQFVTADDVGKVDGTGFYAEGTAPSTDAESLLKAIGVFSVDEDAGEDGGDSEEEQNPYSIHIFDQNTEFYAVMEDMEFDLVLRYEGEDYTGEGLTWSFTTVKGTVSEETALDENGKLTVGNANMAEDEYAVIKVTAALNGDPVVSEDILIAAFRKLTDVRYGFYFYDPEGNKVESGSFEGIASDDSTGPILTSGVTYTIEPYAYHAGTGDDVTQYVDMPSISELLEGASIAIDAGSGQATEEEAKLTETTFVGYVTEDFPVQRPYGIVKQTYSWVLMTEVLVVADDSGDTAAPTVAMESQENFNQTITISNISDKDFPLTVKMYNLSSEEAAYEGDPLQTITITKTEAGVEYTAGEANWGYTEILDLSMTDDVITINYNFVSGEESYLHAVASDVSGNEGSANCYVRAAVGCFVAGTQVQTVNGLVNVEDVKVGDLVYSINLDTNEKVVCPVTWVQGTRFIDATYTIYAGGEEITATYEHPFYVIGKDWVAAEDLVVGDKMMDMNGNEVVITNIVYTKLDAPVQVYNFEVAGTHNYLITETGILAHNIQK